MQCFGTHHMHLTRTITFTVPVLSPITFSSRYIMFACFFLKHTIVMIILILLATNISLGQLAFARRRREN